MTVLALIGVSSRKKRKRLTERVIHKQIRSLVPESQSYIDLLRLEQKLDSVLMRKRLDLQETLKRPQKVPTNVVLSIATSHSSLVLDEEKVADIHQSSISGSLRSR